MPGSQLIMTKDCVITDSSWILTTTWAETLHFTVLNPQRFLSTSGKLFPA